MNDKDKKLPKPRPKAVALDASGNVVELDPAAPSAPAPAKPAKPKLVAVSLDASGKVVESAAGLAPSAPAARKPAPAKPAPPKSAPSQEAAKPAPPQETPKPDAPAEARQPAAPAAKKKPARKPFSNWGPVDVRKSSLQELGRFEREPTSKGTSRRVEVHLAWHKEPAVSIQGFEGQYPFGFFNVRANEVDDLCRMLQEGKKLIEEGNIEKPAPKRPAKPKAEQPKAERPKDDAPAGEGAS